MGKIERQLTDSDCAVWAIKAICFQAGVSVPPANTIRRHIDLEDGGTSIRGVRDALSEFGVSAQPVQGPSDAIDQAPLPAIALIRVAGTLLHYVVVLEANRNRVKYLDPGIGGVAVEVSSSQFADVFTGSLILCERKPDYVAVDFGQEIDANRFLVGAVAHESNAATALCIGEVFQLALLLIGILMLKNFFSSSSLGTPNFWYLGGIAICAVLYLWIGKLHHLIKADVKSRALLSLFNFSTSLIEQHEFDPKKGLRQASSRCVGAVTSVADSLTNLISFPGNTASLLLYLGLMAWFDLYAAGYATLLGVALTVYCVWFSSASRRSHREVLRVRDRNEAGLAFLMANVEPESKVVTDMPWSQLAYCDAVAKSDNFTSLDGTVSASVGRANLIAGLLIGGLQHTTLGMGHTMAVFFMLSIYTSIIVRWSKRVASIPECRFHVRRLLDFLSDFTSDSLQYSVVRNANPKSRVGAPSITTLSVPESSGNELTVEAGGVL
ncbi:cysteine peptidase family C39 domain-containing protein [Mariniblastus fucicola]|uniref:Peptidase C39 family protein n=1 Tax=Mariniblastus fucicola TaxID=980251 RepID=A0A5B9P5B0_9BACT|nr:cysteine peptidase family C39 domain-containing protein [Mariniblastus fucicola]QEG21767.1 Peptidase C39 family protein [Mariniblastus fucicola]